MQLLECRQMSPWHSIAFLCNLLHYFYFTESLRVCFQRVPQRANIHLQGAPFCFGFAALYVSFVCSACSSARFAAECSAQVIDRSSSRTVTPRLVIALSSS